MLLSSSLGFHLTSRETEDALNKCLEGVLGRMRVNKLKLDPDKMEALLVGSGKWAFGRSYTHFKLISLQF